MIHEMHTAAIAQFMVDFSCLFPHEFQFTKVPVR